MDIRRRVGLTIKRLRNEEKWSQEELAERAKLHRTYISQVERGVKNATLISLENIANALGVTVATLVE